MRIIINMFYLRVKTGFFNYISKSIKSQLQNDIKNVCVICYEKTYMLGCCNVCVSQICIECFKKIHINGKYNCPVCRNE